MWISVAFVCDFNGWLSGLRAALHAILTNQPKPLKQEDSRFCCLLKFDPFAEHPTKVYFCESEWSAVTWKAREVVIQSGQLDGNLVLLGQIGPLVGRHCGTVEKCFLCLVAFLCLCALTTTDSETISHQFYGLKSVIKASAYCSK